MIRLKVSRWAASPRLRRARPTRAVLSAGRLPSSSPVPGCSNLMWVRSIRSSAQPLSTQGTVSGPATQSATGSFTQQVINVGSITGASPTVGARANGTVSGAIVQSANGTGTTQVIDVGSVSDSSGNAQTMSVATSTRFRLIQIHQCSESVSVTPRVLRFAVTEAAVSGNINQTIVEAIVLNSVYRLVKP